MVQVLHYDYQHCSKADSPLPKVVEQEESKVLCLSLEISKGQPSCISTGKWTNSGYSCGERVQKKSLYLLMDCKVEIQYLTSTILFLTHPL